MTGFDLATLPYCSFTAADLDGPRVGVGLGDRVLDLTTLAQTLVPDQAPVFAAGTLDRFLAAGPQVWARVRAALQEAALEASPTRPVGEVRLHLPFAVADYVDFYASRHHATNVGRIFRPDGEPLTPNWDHLPIGYHGRAGTVVVSGTPVRRPSGQLRSADGTIGFGPSARLDVEAEIGFVVGAGSDLGQQVGVGEFEQHVFGICVVNDWSARDIQAWEYVPLGPFLGKSFATSVSPWVVPWAALTDARTDPPPPHVELQDYLSPPGQGLDLELTVAVNGTVVSRPPFATMSWTPAQMLAHLTVNGASLRPGDLFASGTVSGPEPGQRGSLLELTWNGTEPVTLDDGSTRGFLQDGDTVTISAAARTHDGRLLPLGEVEGRVV
ncbi:fumarylacetoacetase [Aeromicrobium senzhongii]|uniref:fumarylacetoacetase n=1 Tax=Aeromicrobium senzhongii TaxID=2663859 RepID=A0ABX6SPN6_9ACTN|nr:fumarylacetoacetase [Aeromicrobium senzhongii]MTB86814.1 fumarylacetoacetase [Aeromicrobium senzhongii]QNL93346.1 fumarylacetoacetase [Aeromicrobium senzhongii]